MLKNNFYNFEEELLHIIRVNGSTFGEYQKTVSKIQNINYTDDNDRSFLHGAVGQGKLDIVKDLLHRGIDVNLQDVNGCTAAMYAVSNKQWDMLNEILKCHPDVNLKDWRYGNTLLFDAACQNNEKGNAIAKKLIDMGANPYSENHNGKSPLDLAVLTKNSELIEIFQGVEKPEQETPEKFRVPKKARGYFKLNFRDYAKYILVKDASLSYLEDKITDYSAICGGKKVTYKFEIIPMPKNLWTVILCPPKMDFYNYHNMMSWIVGLNEKEPLKQTICIALHKNDERLSYYGIMDKEYSDTRLLGRFQNGESFSVYLPEAFQKDGNAQSFRDYLPIKTIDKYLELYDFQYKWITELSELSSTEIIVDMAAN